MKLFILLGLFGFAFCDPLLFKSHVSKGGNQLCPDKQGTCPDESTCCLLSSGKYGCCPLKKATCCSDHIHCCPNGYTCDTAAAKCNPADGPSIPLFKKFAASPVTEDVPCPGGSSSCPSGSTCCKISGDEYGCCPLPEATCCSDGQHCCPHGYKCDAGAGTCSQGISSFSWKSITDSKVKFDESDVECPDGKSRCPDGSTCCLLISGQYGCCPQQQAVCCSDHIHCCPQGTKCDVQHSKCLRSTGESIPWSIKGPSKPMPSLQKPKVEDDIKCPDDVSTCPAGTTCCKMLSGYYGCCPMPNAVCCKDHLHCCASTETCDEEKGICKDGNTQTPWGTKFPAKTAPSEPAAEEATGEEGVACQGGQYYCPTGSTCCRTKGGWGCCPLPKAVCCRDGAHCCPHGYRCNPSSSACSMEANIIQMKSISIQPAKEVSSDVKCPDGKSTCPEKTTCCKLQSGFYGCCPFDKAQCCADKLHCCPQGYTCDTAQGTCKKGETSITWLQKSPAKPIPSIEKVVKCKNNVTCKDGQTCCKMISGGYGCCPAKNASCCEDELHCCPSNYTCKANKCVKNVDPIDSGKNLLGAVICPDKTSQCQDGQTCCKLPGGTYGCCPLPEAVCCSDGLHCCPKGSKCNLAQGTCDSLTNSLSFSWDMVKRSDSFSVKVKETVKCADESECPEGKTCCALQSGKYGCCPLPNATCCSDKVHCCPNGYSCTKEGTCTKAGSSLEMTWWSHSKTQSTRSSSCCKNGGSSCCPSGSSCDEESGECLESIPWLEKEPSMGAGEEDKSDAVMCPDHQHECPNGSTCCKLVSGQWGCCPMEKAVCCSDGEHCCPEGYKCNVQAGSCVKQSNDESLSFIQIIKSD